MSADLRAWVEDSFPGGKWVKPDEYRVSSPLREERTPSFDINISKRCFNDRGGEAGKLTDLAERLGIEPPPWDGQPAKVERPAKDVNKILAADAIRRRWNEAQEATEHAYLARKGLEMVPGLKVDGKGNLLVPSRDLDGRLIGLQEIAPGGSKRFMKGSHMGTFVLGDLAEGDSVLVAEGLATGAALWQALGLPVIVAFSAGRVSSVVRELRGRTSATVVVATDADDAGRKAAADAGVESFIPPGEGGRDWADALLEEGPEAIVEAWQSRAVPAKKKPRGFRLVRFDELEAKEPQWLIEGLLEQDSLISIFGESGSGKSFFTLDLSFCIASGTPFHGRFVEQGPVIYLAGEGFSGLARRRAAWEKHHVVSLRGAPIFVSNQAPALLDAASAVEVARAVEAVSSQVGAPRLVVVDTLARAFAGGDENSSADMGAFVRSLDGLKARYGCSVLVVHHSGHGDKSRSRGSSAFRGALDAEMLVEGVPGRSLSVKNTKQKDGPAFEDLHFELQDVEIEPGITSAVLVEAEGPAKEERPLTSLQHAALRAFRSAIEHHGKIVGGQACLDVESWRPAFYGLSTGDNPDAKRKQFQRARDGLIERGRLRIENGLYFVTCPLEQRAQVALLQERDEAGQTGHVPPCPDVPPCEQLHIAGQTGHSPLGDVPVSRLAVVPDRAEEDIDSWFEKQPSDMQADYQERLARLQKAGVVGAEALARQRVLEAAVR